MGRRRPIVRLLRPTRAIRRADRKAQAGRRVRIDRRAIPGRLRLERTKATRRSLPLRRRVRVRKSRRPRTLVRRVNRGLRISPAPRRRPARVRRGRVRPRKARRKKLATALQNPRNRLRRPSTKVPRRKKSASDGGRFGVLDWPVLLSALALLLASLWDRGVLMPRTALAELVPCSLRSAILAGPECCSATIFYNRSDWEIVTFSLDSAWA